MAAGYAHATVLGPLPGEQGQVPSPLPSDPRCTMTISHPVVDFGVMSRGQLQEIPGQGLSPGIRSLSLSVVCPYARAIKLLVQGDGREQGGMRYGKDGFTRFRLLDVQVDGHAQELRASTPEGAIAGSGQGLVLIAGQQLAPVARDQWVEGRTLTARLEIQPVLSPAQTRVSHWERSESTLTLTLVN
ncbi:fimbrial protein [Pseudomonas sp. TKO26]|nr:fimbrial protein [Pseudomonas sp. TKO30]PYY93634.1 fimbrial protein [Pseudomonas sp. TKO29]PYY95862.1 fimbrial protein [Pseudomonas sp. TKO26]PYZ01793.1 fimbrial protein [Pseudomonas sp. TKO14]